MREIKKEVPDEPSPSVNEAYQIYFVKEENTEEDSTEDGEVKTMPETSKIQDDDHNLRSSHKGGSSSRQTPGEDEEKETSSRQEPQVGNPTLQDNSHGIKSNQQLSGESEEIAKKKAIQAGAQNTCKLSRIGNSNTNAGLFSDSESLQIDNRCMMVNVGSRHISVQQSDSQQRLHTQEETGDASHSCKPTIGRMKKHRPRKSEVPIIQYSNSDERVTKSDFTLDMTSDIVEKPYRCLECGKRFGCNGSLTRHEDIHKGGNPSDKNMNQVDNNHQHSRCNEQKDEKRGKKSDPEIQPLRESRSTHPSNTGLLKDFVLPQRESNFRMDNSGSSQILDHEGYSRHQSDSEEDLADFSNCDEHKMIKKPKQTDSEVSSHQSFQCFSCDTQCTTKWDFSFHMMAHIVERPHQCSNCNKIFCDESHFLEHPCVKTQTDEQPYQCSDCNEELCGESHFLERCLEMPTGEKVFPCSECKMSFSQKNELTKYKRNHTGHKPNQCSECGKRFFQKRELMLHMRIHTGERPHECSICRRRFSLKGTLRKHMIIHSGEKFFHCSICNKKFAHSNTLTRHVRTHTGEKPFSCVKCNKRFSQKSGLEVHQRTHTGEKRYQCSVCGKRISAYKNMVDHMRAHKGERPYQCSVCKKSFVRPSSLAQHVKIHTGEKPHHCSVCSKRFISANALKRHMKTHTGEKPHQCLLCGKAFGLCNSLTKHMMIHTGEKPYECSMCDKSFRYRSRLTEHIKIHTGENPNQCAICNKKFSQKSVLQDHMRIHTGEKPYKCSVCDKKFSQRSGLAVHKQTHTVE